MGFTMDPIFAPNYAKIFMQKLEKTYIRVKVFENRPSKICGRQPLKNLK